MKLTKETLKQIIKEELDANEQDLERRVHGWSLMKDSSLLELKKSKK